jgi:hypothetical protein
MPSGFSQQLRSFVKKISSGIKFDTRILSLSFDLAQKRTLAPAFVLIFVFTGILLALVMRAAFSTPFQDELLFGPLYSALAKGQLPPFSELLAAHHGHPYLLLKLLITITLLIGLPWSWMMYAQLVILPLCAGIVLAARSSARSAAVALVTVSVLLSPRQWENLYWAMQIVFPLFLLTSLAAFSAVDRFCSTGKVGWAYSALATGLLASVCNGAGVFSLALTCIALMVGRRDRPTSTAALITLIAGVGLFFFSQSIGPRSGIGRQPLDWLLVLEHIVWMFAHQFVYGRSESIELLALGVGALLLVLYVVKRCMLEWRDCIFEFLCIALSLIVIVGISYSRVSSGIFQPDAPRYLPLIAPLTIGTILLLARLRRAWLLYAVLATVSIGYAQSLLSEWKTTPYRKLYSMDAHRALCNAGPVDQMQPRIKGAALSDIRALFCSDFAASTVRQIDHSSIDKLTASGFYQEERHTWIGPQLILAVPPGIENVIMEIHGWLPDITAYPDERFVVEVVSDGSTLAQQVIDKPGDFGLSVTLPESVSVLEVRASARHATSVDARKLSWLLVSITFN